MPEKEKKSAQNSENDELARKSLNKMKMLDAVTAFIVSLVIFACAYGFLVKYIGVFALLISCVLSVASVFLLIRLTGLKARTVLKFSSPKKSHTLGAALLLAAAMILSVPPILFSQLLAPRLAATSFNIYSIVGGSSGVFSAILVVIFIAVCENILFDGYIYSRLGSMSSVILRAVFTSIMAAVMRFDVYAFSSVFIASLAAFTVRRETASLTLPLVIRLFSVSFITAVSGLSASANELVGEAMGAVQVIGLTLIFVGIAIPVSVLAFASFGRLRQNGKLVGFLTLVFSIILIAAGCGVSSL